jgi:hypothetical protein
VQLVVGPQLENFLLELLIFGAVGLQLAQLFGLGIAQFPFFLSGFPSGF